MLDAGDGRRRVTPMLDADGVRPRRWTPMRVRFLTVLLSCALAFAGTARASDERPPPVAGPVVGGVVTALVSHLAAREWKRAAVFGAITVGLAALSIGLCEGLNAYADFGPFEGRVLFPAALAVELVASGVGLFDSLNAAERWRDRHAAPPAASLVKLGGSFR
jgi:peptidoglycan/LPS O-acetylase OafA/YrhL